MGGWLVILQQVKFNVNLSAKTRFPIISPSISPEEEHEGLEEVSEVVVALEGGARVELDVAEELHADDGVDEEQHEHEQPDIRQGLQL